MKQLDIYMSDTTAEPRELHLAEVYAEALLDSLDENTTPADAADELRELAKTIENTKGANELLNSPILSATHKMKIARKLGTAVSEPVAGLLVVLARNHRFNLIDQIAKACDKVAMRKAGEIEFIARTAVAMNEDEIKNLQQQLGSALGCDCVIKNVVDDKIIGGLVLQKGDTVFDASLAGDLGRIADAIEKKNSTGNE